MAKNKIDEEKLMELVKAQTPVADIAKQLGIDSMAYARTKVKEAIAKQQAADYPDLFVGKGAAAVSSQIQPKLTKKGSINLNAKLLDSWGINPPEGTAIDMKVSRDKTKITLILGEGDGSDD